MLSHGLVAWSCFLDEPATGLWFSQFSAGIDAAGHGRWALPEWQSSRRGRSRVTDKRPEERNHWLGSGVASIPPQW